MMEPVIKALISAMSSDLNDPTYTTVKKSYNEIKQAIGKKLGSIQIIDELEAHPESRQHQQWLAETLINNGVMDDPEISALAQRLADVLEKKEQQPNRSVKYYLKTPKGQVGVIGDRVHIEGGIHFHNHSGEIQPKPLLGVVPPITKENVSPPEPQAHRLAKDYQPGGALETECPFYIQRQADTDVMEGVDRKRGLVTLKGPSQTGKTSMMLRLYALIRSSQSRMRPVLLDFQSLPTACFGSLGDIWRSVATEVDDQLRVDALDDTLWRSKRSYDRNLTGFLERFVFKDDTTPLLIIMDEVNQVFGMPIRSEFFSSVRAFYNRGAIDPVWKKVRWCMSTSSEPRFFIDDLNQSPFNVGTKVHLEEFNVQEIGEFVRRYGFSPSEDRGRRIMDYLGGRPYLVHLLLHHMALRSESEAALMDAGKAGAGIFKAHLDHYLTRFQEQPDLAAAMKRVTAGKGCDDVRMADRLAAAGLVREDENGKIICACELYLSYFSRRL